MHFAPSEEQAMIAEAAARFFAEQATPARTHRVVDEASGIDAALWHDAAASLGLPGLILPETMGGTGAGFVELALVAEAAGRHVAAIPLMAAAAASAAILAGGSADQRAAWLPLLASGARRATVAVTGPAGDPDAPGVTAEGGRLSGSAYYVPDGGGADLFVVAVQGGGMALVARDAPGVRVERHVSLDMTRPHATVRLDGARGEPLGNPVAARAALLDCGWLCLAADALGGAQACLDRTVAYAGERVQFGRAIGSFQAVKHKLADMMVLVEQARSAVWWAAGALDADSAEVPLALHAAKAFATDAYAQCAGAMIQLHGGVGFTWEHDAHIFLKRARVDQTLLGTPGWHRERIAALIGLDEAA